MNYQVIGLQLSPNLVPKTYYLFHVGIAVKISESAVAPTVVCFTSGYTNVNKQDAHVREQSRIRNLFTNLIGF